MPFVNGLFLIGTAAAAIPLVLHLVHTTRAPQTPFPTLRFLRIAAEKTARRRRVQNLFLLVLRMLLFALLALALARPFVSHDLSLLAGGASQAAIILDNSMSQGVTYGGKSRLEHLKREAEALLKSRLRPAEALLLVADGPLSRREARPLRDRDELIRRIRRTEVGAGRADLAALLKKAYAAFDATRGANRRIYIFTDRQAQSWDGVADLPEVAGHREIPVCVIHVDSPDSTNVAVTGVRAAGTDRMVGFPVPIEVRLWSSPEIKGRRYLSLYADDMTRPRERMAVTLPVERGKNDRVLFRPGFSTAGPHRLRVEIDAEDSLPVDNARRLVVGITGNIRTLLVRDPRGLTGADDPAFYLEAALAGPTGDTEVPWPIHVETAAPTDLSDERLADADAVVLADVAGLDAELHGRLEAFVKQGRTLIVFPGPATVPARWHRPAADDGDGTEPLLPAALGTVKSESPDDRGPAKVIAVAENNPLLAGLADLQYYQRVVVSRYVLLGSTAPGTAEVLLGLDTGDPLLVAGRRGSGNVYLFAVPASGDWSNLQRTNIFLPLVLRLVYRSVRRASWPAEIVSGEPARLAYGPESGAPFDLAVADPEHPGAPRHQKPDAGTTDTFTLSDTFALGFYDLAPVTASPRPDLAWTFAVNPDGRESDLTPLGLDELRQRVKAHELYLASSMADVTSQLASLGRQELWQHFLVGVLLLTVFECLVSNRLRPRGDSRGVQTLVDRLLGRSPAARREESSGP